MSQQQQQHQEEMLHLCLTGFYLRKPVKTVKLLSYNSIGCRKFQNFPDVYNDIFVSKTSQFFGNVLSKRTERTSKQLEENIRRQFYQNRWPQMAAVVDKHLISLSLGLFKSTSSFSCQRLPNLIKPHQEFERNSDHVHLKWN